MIQTYVKKLIENLPDDITKKKKPLVLDLVLDGGAFNGNYLVGALYFLKEMEKRGFVRIDRISGCSVGSFVGLLYFLDELDCMVELNSLILQDFKTFFLFNKIKCVLNSIKNKLPKDICNKINDKLFITYNNVHTKKTIKSKYKNTDDIVETILKSSFIPFCIDGKLTYKNKYIDGFTPYIFKPCQHKKILYLNLFSYDKFTSIINVKNERNVFNRLLCGLLDIHNFFIKQTKTSMCSYVDEWSILDKSLHNIKLLCEIIIIYIVKSILFIKKILNIDTENSLVCKILSRIIFDVYSILLENYCL
jgi:hypothetical protein